MPTPTLTIQVPSVCVLLSIVCGFARRGGGGSRVGGWGDIRVEVEGVGITNEAEVEVEEEVEWLKLSRFWASASLFFFSAIFFPFLFASPERSSYRAFIDCHECDVTPWASARRHSLFPLTGERCLLALTKAKRALCSVGVYFFRVDISKEKAISPSVMNETKGTYRHYSMGPSHAAPMPTSLNPIHNLCPQL